MACPVGLHNTGPLSGGASAILSAPDHGYAFPLFAQRLDSRFLIEERLEIFWNPNFLVWVLSQLFRDRRGTRRPGLFFKPNL